MKKFIAALSLMASLGVNAETSPIIVTFEKNPRAVVFDGLRTWMTRDGVLLVCPFEFNAYTNKTCNTANDEKWIQLSDYKVEGHSLDSYQVVPKTGPQLSSFVIIAYYKPNVVKPAVVEKAAPSLSCPITIRADNVTIQTNKVIVHRRRAN